MKKIAGLCSLLLACTSVMAEKTTSPASLISVLDTLNAQSYIVIKLEYEHHGFEAHVITPQGFLKKIRFNEAGTQEISQTEETGLLSMEAVLLLVEKAGYTGISSVKVVGAHRYKMEAKRGRDEKEMELEIDAKTGDIHVEREWWDVL